jgi:hypothetical protein
MYEKIIVISKKNKYYIAGYTGGKIDKN